MAEQKVDAAIDVLLKKDSQDGRKRTLESARCRYCGGKLVDATREWYQGWADQLRAVYLYIIGTDCTFSVGKCTSGSCLAKQKVGV